MKRRKMISVLACSVLGLSTVSLLLAGIIKGGFLAQTSSGFRNLVNHNDDPQYYSICSTEANLYGIEGDRNMMPSDLYVREPGLVRLAEGRSFRLRNDSYYTFVIYVSDPDALKNAGASSDNILSISYTPIRNDHSGTLTSLKTVQRNQTPRQLFEEGSTSGLYLSQVNMSALFVSFRIINDANSYSQGTSTVSEMTLDFNSLRDSGFVSGFQLYKGATEDYPGYEDFQHEPCGITDEWEGPYQSGKLTRISVPYGSDSFTIAKLTKTVKAYDLGDGGYRNVFLVSDGYTGHENELGVDLDVIYGSDDSRGNRSQLTFRINLFDAIPPDIRQVNADFRISYTKTLTDDLLLSNFSFSDNYLDSIADLRIEGIDYAAVGDKLGAYDFTVKATDASGNASSLKSRITIIDDVAPVIDGADYVSAKAGEAVTDEEILGEYSATDAKDGSCGVAIENNTYQGYENAVGLYTVDIVSYDASGNKAVKPIVVNVVDADGPLFYINKTYISSFGTEIITPEQALAMLVRNKTLPEKIYVYSEYIGGDYPLTGSVSEGIYKTRLAAYAESGDIEYADLTIEVKPDKSSADSIGFWDRLMLGAYRFFEKLFGFMFD